MDRTRETRHDHRSGDPAPPGPVQAYVQRAWFGTTPALRDVTYPVIADPAQEVTRHLGVLDATLCILRALPSDERVLQLVA